MLRFVGEYCKACDLCLRTKAWCCKPMGKLHSWPIPENCWDTVSVDFISELPELHGYDTIIVVINLTSKHGPFHTHPYYSNCTGLCVTLLATCLETPWTSAFCPVWSWPTVHVAVHALAVLPPWHQNFSIHCLSSPNWWPDRMCQPITGAIPMCFHEWEAGWLGWMAAYGWVCIQQSHPLLHATHAILHQHRATSSYRVWTSAIAHQGWIVKSKDDMACYYNQHHTPTPTFVAGDKVFLDASDIHITCPSKKLSHYFLGPFPVVHPVGSHTYHLQLPPSMSSIHPVFHVVKLMLVPEDPIGQQVCSPPAPTVIGGKQYYEVESILNSRLRAGKLEFLVNWKGYGYKENSWVSECCKGNLTIEHNTQILARGIQSILDKYNTAEGCIPCKGHPKRKL